MRQDIPVAQQIVQTNHATFQMAQRLGGFTDTPFVVVVGLPDKAALEATIQRLNRYGIDHEAFHEPDNDMGLSAIATVPLTSKKHRKAMLHYKLWTPSQEAAYA